MLKTPVTSHDHIRGDEHAPVTLVEYGDYECPHCVAAQPVVNALIRAFDDRMLYVYRHFPLGGIHPHATMAAEAAEFAGDQGQFWEMHDAIFECQGILDPSALAECATAVGLPASELVRALAEHRYTERVRKHFVGGARSGVNGTPTFFINNERYQGPADVEWLSSAIEAAEAAVPGHPLG